MTITNQLSINAYRGYVNSGSRLAKSMERLSANERLVSAGDAPADWGVSQNRRFQIQNAEEARRNIENGKNLISSTDQWLQVTHNILDRMSELAIASIDGSKTEAERASLSGEFDQLKAEVARIAKEAHYNGIQVAGRDQVLTYDRDQQTFIFMQPDGKEVYPLGRTVLTGLKSTNGQDYLFDSTKEYTLSSDGRHLIYADSNNNLVRLDIESGNLVRDTSDNELKSFQSDDAGRFWYATETVAGSHVFSLRQQSLDTWSLDTSLVSTSSITDMASQQFSVFQDRVTYLSTSGSIVSRDLHALSNFKNELSPAELAFNSTDGQFAISPDGTYIADLSAPGSLRVINLETKQHSTFVLDPSLTVSHLSFNEDSSSLTFVNHNGSLHTVEMKPGSHPELTNERLLQQPSGALGFAGVNLKGSSNRSQFRLHNGPGSSQESFLTAGDVRLYRLGIANAQVNSVDAAKAAIGWLQNAVERVSIQRSRLGAEENRLSQTYESLIRYSNEMSQADSALRDVDVAKETCEMVKAQVFQETAIAMMSQANAKAESLLRLLYR